MELYHRMKKFHQKHTNRSAAENTILQVNGKFIA